MTMITYHTEDILGTRSRVAVLRVLAHVAVPLSIRQIAVQAGVSHVSAMTALEPLVRHGVVGSSVAGRSRVHWLERRNVITRDVVLPLFEAEDRSGEALIETLRALMPAELEAAVLYGGYARGDMRPDSDIDVLVVARDQQAVDAALDELDAAAAEINAATGATVSVLGHTMEQVLALRGNGTFVDDMFRDGVVICGTPPDKWGDQDDSTQDSGDGGRSR
jgi:predicted nucleotidyltransferase